MRKRRKNTPLKLSLLFITVLFLLASTSISYSLWYEELYIQGTITTGTWDNSCIRIMKTLHGSFTDPCTGDNQTVETDYILVANETNSTKFNLTICIENCGSTDLTNVWVNDTIGLSLGPRSWKTEPLGIGTVTWEHRPHGGGSEWDGIHFCFNDLYWYIGDLNAGDQICLEIRLETLQNPSDKYAPTSEDQDLEFQLEDKGATVEAWSEECGTTLTSTTGPLTLDIDPTDDDPCSNGVKLAKIVTPRPWKTPWAEASC